jgi:exodeoxyribonuclease VII large subunit
VRADLLSQIDSLARRQLSCWGRGIEARRTELRAASRALPSADGLLAVPRQKLDSLAERLPRALKANAEIHHKQYLRCATKLSPRLLQNRIRGEHERLDNFISRARRCTQVHQERRVHKLDALGIRLGAAKNANFAAHRQRIVRDREKIVALFERGGRAVTRLIERRTSLLERATGLLAALSYHGVLARGFALVRDGAGKPLRAAAQVSAGLALDIEFHDGHAGAVANGGDGAPRVAQTSPKPELAKPEPAKAKPRKSGGEGQGSLFG